MATPTIQSITQRAQEIQSGISKLSSAESAGLKITPQTTVQQASAYTGPVGGAIVGGGTNTSGVPVNVRDLPGYVPGSLPGDKTSTQQVDTSRPSPETINDTTGVNNPQTDNTQALKPTDQAPKDLVNQVQQAQSQVDALKQKYTGIYNTANKIGGTSPVSQGAASNAINQIDKAITPPTTPPTPPPVEQFLNPASNPDADKSIQALREILSPESDRKALNDEIANLASDRAELRGLKTELMNTKRVMAGTEQEIRDEITKAGGFATNSQVLGLTIARNKALVQKGQDLQDQISTQTDLVNSDVSLVGDMKQTAQQQFQNNMSILNYQQTNYNNQMTAFRDGIKTLASDNPQGLLTAMQADPVYAQRVQSANPAYTPQALQGLVSSKSLDNQYKNLQIQKLQQDINGTVPGTTAFDKNQQKLETDYKNTLLKELSNRSGGLGLQDAKVNQAIHLKALVNQYSDGKGGYSIPAAQQSELAMGLANLVSGTNTVSDSARDEINKRTAKGDFNGAISYITGTPKSANTNAMFKNLIDSIDRQGGVAEDLRDQYIQTLHGFAPTDLEQSRRDSLEKATLPSYRSYDGKLENTPIKPADISSAKFNGLNVTLGNGGTLAFPSMEALNLFKKDHNLK